MRAHIVKFLGLSGDLDDASRASLFSGIVIAVLYFALAKLGLVLATEQLNASPVWPASGFSVAALLVFGPIYWPSIFVGAFFANLFAPTEALPSLFIAIGNTLEGLLAVAILKRVLTFKSELHSQHETLGYIAASILPSFIGAGVGAGSLLAFGKISVAGLTDVALTWWVGDAIGILVVAPFLADFFEAPSRVVRETFFSGWKANILLAFALGVVAAIFIGRAPSVAIYAIYPLMFLVVVRLGGHAIRVFAICASAISIYFTISGTGVFQTGTTNQNLICLQIFLASIGLMALALGGFKSAKTLRIVVASLVLTWALTAIVTHVFESAEVERDQARFEKLSTMVADAVIDRFSVYENALKGGVALFAASDSVARDAWKAYNETLDLTNRYPGIHGVGVISPVAKKDVPRFLSKIRKDKAPDFALRPVPGPILADFIRPDYTHFVLTYMEPEAVNKAALGLDLGSEANRRAAAELSRDSGKAAITSRIILAQSTGKPGFLLLLPFYKGGKVPATLADRRANHIGWVDAAFASDIFFHEVIHAVTDEIETSVFDGASGATWHLYGTSEKLSSTFERSQTIEFGQHPFVLGWNRSKRFQSAHDTTGAWLSAFGTIMSLLIGAVVSALKTTGLRATQLASERTLQLQQRENELRRLNGDLENRVRERTTQIEEANTILAASQARLSAVIDQSPFATQLITKDGQVTRVNRAWQRLWNISDEAVESVILNTYNVLSDPTLKELGVTPFIKRAIEGEKLSMQPMLYDPAQAGYPGRPRWVEVHLSPVFSAAGEIEEIILVFSDVTSQVEANDAVEGKRAELQAILDHSPAVIFMKDPDGRMILSNKRLEEIVGKGADEIRMKTDLEIWPEDIANKFAEGDRGILANGKPIFEEVNLTSKDGERTYLTSRFPIFDKRGRIRAICGIATDISGVARIEKEKALLEVRERSALEASRLKSEFLANMSHEIRTPINGIIGMTELLADTSMDKDQAHFVESISTSSKSLLAIVNDILDLSKVEAGKIELVNEPFRLTDLVEDVRSAFAPLIADRGLEFKVASDFPSDLWCRGDSGRVRQVLTNLVGNAVKFTERGEIRLHAKSLRKSNLKAEVQFSVEDTGIGISKSAQAGLFQSFSQADTSMARRYGGSGLGLAISKRLTELMGGTIDVESDLGRGSTFSFSIEFDIHDPSDEMPLSIPQISDSSGAEREHHARILVAEDNLINKEITIRMLRKAGYQVDGVVNGREALAALDQNEYDLVVMDCQMPEVDGYEATRRMRARGSRIPVIALTANAFKEDRDRCLAAGMSDYAAKPIGEKDLVQLVDVWLTANGPPQSRSLEESRAESFDGDAIIDPEAIRRIRAIDRGPTKNLLKRLVVVYGETMRSGLQELRDLDGRENEPGVRKRAHAMKASNLSLGATRVAKILKTIEIDPWTRADLEKLLEDLEDEFLLASDQLIKIANIEGSTVAG